MDEMATEDPRNPALPFDGFLAVCKPLSFAQADLTIARGVWRVLDFEQQQKAISGIQHRIDCGEYEDPAYVPLPQTYLRNHLWERPLRVKRKATQAELRALPKEQYVITPATVGFLDWAEEHGYKLMTGADVVKAEEAYRRCGEGRESV